MACWNQPIEVIRVEMQSQKVAADRPKNMNIFSCARYIYKNNGLAGFYRGVTPRVALGVYLTVFIILCHNDNCRFVWSLAVTNSRRLPAVGGANLSLQNVFHEQPKLPSSSI